MRDNEMRRSTAIERARQQVKDGGEVAKRRSGARLQQLGLVAARQTRVRAAVALGLEKGCSDPRAPFYMSVDMEHMPDRRGFGRSKIFLSRVRLGNGRKGMVLTTGTRTSARQREREREGARQRWLGRSD